jgi:uncharacterized membrane protein
MKKSLWLDDENSIISFMGFLLSNLMECIEMRRNVAEGKIGKAPKDPETVTKS